MSRESVLRLSTACHPRPALKSANSLAHCEMDIENLSFGSKGLCDASRHRSLRPTTQVALQTSHIDIADIAAHYDEVENGDMLHGHSVLSVRPFVPEGFDRCLRAEIELSRKNAVAHTQTLNALVRF
jgi:hypothetical protein